MGENRLADGLEQLLQGFGRFDRPRAAGGRRAAPLRLGPMAGGEALHERAVDLGLHALPPPDRWPGRPSRESSPGGRRAPDRAPRGQSMTGLLARMILRARRCVPKKRQIGAPRPRARGPVRHRAGDRVRTTRADRKLAVESSTQCVFLDETHEAVTQEKRLHFLLYGATALRTKTGGFNPVSSISGSAPSGDGFPRTFLRFGFRSSARGLPLRCIPRKNQAIRMQKGIFPGSDLVDTYLSDVK